MNGQRWSCSSVAQPLGDYLLENGVARPAFAVHAAEVEHVQNVADVERPIVRSDGRRAGRAIGDDAARETAGDGAWLRTFGSPQLGDKSSLGAIHARLPRLGCNRCATQ